jgi:hypothetical protein
MATGDRQATFTEHGSRVWVDAIGLGGEALSAGEDGGIRRWDLTTHKELSPLLPPGRETFRALAVSTDGRIAMAGSDRAVWFLDLDGSHQPERVDAHRASSVP